MKLAVTQTPVEKYQPTLVWKTLTKLPNQEHLEKKKTSSTWEVDTIKQADMKEKQNKIKQNKN